MKTAYLKTEGGGVTGGGLEGGVLQLLAYSAGERRDWDNVLFIETRLMGAGSKHNAIREISLLVSLNNERRMKQEEERWLSQKRIKEKLKKKKNGKEVKREIEK